MRCGITFDTNCQALTRHLQAQQLVPTIDAMGATLESLILNRRSGVSHVDSDSSLVTHLADLLFHILPAIDTNDSQKTYSALKFYYGIVRYYMRRQI